MALAFLQGPPLFAVILNRQDLDRLLDGVGDAVQRHGRLLLERLGAVAIDLLREMEAGVGRNWLGPQWKKGPVRKVGDAYYIEVYNAAEGKTLRNTDWRGIRTSAHTITGRRLLAILEGGAKPHSYAASAPGRALVFESPAGGHRSFKEPLHAKGLVAAYLYGDDTEDKIVAPYGVDHPGVRASGFVARTKELIEERLAAEAAAAAKQISVSVK